MTITSPRLDHTPADAQSSSVEPGTDTPADQRSFDTQDPSVGGGQNTDTSQTYRDTQAGPAGAGQTPPPTTRRPIPIAVASAGAETPPPANLGPAPTPSAPVVDPLLFVHASAHHDLEQQRIASENRLRSLTRTEPDTDGQVRGLGLPESHPDVARLAGITDALRDIEHNAELGLARSLRRSAIYPWVKAQRGLGDKQVARLLSATGDPYWHTGTFNEDGTVRHPEGPRTVSELWAYCGYHVLAGDRTISDTQSSIAAGLTLPADHADTDTRSSSVGGGKPAAGHLRADAQGTSASGPALPADHSCGDTHTSAVGGGQTGNPDHSTTGTHSGIVGVAAKRRKGQKANWSTDAKTRAYLIATSCLKQLDAECRDGHQDGHADGCRCSPYRIRYDQRRAVTAATHPDWTDGHSHQDGLRVAAKEILKHLWREAKRLHEEMSA